MNNCMMAKELVKKNKRVITRYAGKIFGDLSDESASTAGGWPELF